MLILKTMRSVKLHVLVWQEENTGQLTEDFVFIFIKTEAYVRKMAKTIHNKIFLI